MQSLPSLSYGPAITQKRPSRLPFGNRVPLDVYIAKNPIINRHIIELLGYDGWVLLLARNNFERIEKFLDSAMWYVVGVGLPLLSGLTISRLAMKQLLKRAPGIIAKKSNPLNISFDLLAKILSKKSLSAAEKTALKQHNINLPSKNTLRWANIIANTKLSILLVDMFFMASKGQSYFYLKNWLTERLSGKKGFSGEFSYTNEAYRNEKSSFYQRNKKTLHLISAIIGYAGNLSLPLLIWIALKHPKKVPKALLSVKNKLLQRVGYIDVIFMNKFVLGWHTANNWILTGSITARDNHERREHLVRTASAFFFWMIADDLIMGAYANYFQNQNKRLLHSIQNGVKKPIQLVEKHLLGCLPIGVSYPDLYANLEGGIWKNTLPKTKLMLKAFARRQFWLGILSTAAGLGISVTLINNWYTKQKVLQEQSSQ